MVWDSAFSTTSGTASGEPGKAESSGSSVSSHEAKSSSDTTVLWLVMSGLWFPAGGDVASV